MSSRSSLPPFAAVAVAIAIALPCTQASGLRAQDLALSRAVVDRGFTVRTEMPGAPAASALVAAHTDVTAGLFAECTGLAGDASVTGAFTQEDQTLRYMLATNCTLAAASGASATAGDPSVLHELSVPRPMTVRFTTYASTLTDPNAPSFRSLVDVGDDGQPELEFVSRPGASGGFSNCFDVALPAGPLRIRLALDFAVPATVEAAASRFACLTAHVIVEPAHVVAESEGGDCGTSVHATPLLDGTNVRFAIGGGPWTLARLLVLGPTPTAVTLPAAPWCPLLVVPDVVVLQPPTTELVLPLALLGQVEWFAQGIALRPATPWEPTPQWLTSARLRLRVQ